MGLTVNRGVVPYIGAKNVTEYEYEITENVNTTNYTYTATDTSITPNTYYLGEDSPTVVEAELSKPYHQIKFYYDANNPEVWVGIEAHYHDVYVQTGPESGDLTRYDEYDDVTINYSNGQSVSLAPITSQWPSVPGSDKMVVTGVNKFNIRLEHTGNFTSEIILDANGSQTDKCKITGYGSSGDDLLPHVYVTWEATYFERIPMISPAISYYAEMDRRSPESDYVGVTGLKTGVVLPAQLKNHTTCNVEMTVTES